MAQLPADVRAGPAGSSPGAARSSPSCKQARYTRSWYGKNHNVPNNPTSPAGPFGEWPTSQGFDHFDGFSAAETDELYPSLIRNTEPVEPPRRPEEGYVERSLGVDAAGGSTVG